VDSFAGQLYSGALAQDCGASDAPTYSGEGML